jgi:putative ABC transport system permease protein
MKLRALGQRRAVKREIDEELRLHVEMRTAENIAEGMTAQEAAQVARKRFGNVQSVREECRDIRGASFGETTLRDISFGSRLLRKNPAFTTIAAVTLGLGIGASSSVFSLVQGVLLTPTPYPNPQQVILVSPARLDKQPYARGCATAQWLEWQKEAKSFAVMAGYHWEFSFLVLGDGSEAVRGLWVTPDYFSIIGVQPEIGRVFSSSEASSKPVSAVIIAHDLWKRRFNGETNIIGQIIQLNASQVTVVGVMPPDIRFLPSPQNAHLPNYDANARIDYWLPDSADLAKPKASNWNVAGRLRDGATLIQAQTELTAIAARQAQADHDFEGLTAKAELLTVTMNREARRLLLPLSGAVLCVFLIACGNVAGLLLARGLQRQQEYAVRCALGAGRGQLFRQTLTESLLLALFGGALGAGLAAATVKVLKLIAGVAIPRLDAVTIGWPMLAFGCASAVVAALMAGLAPAFQASRLDPASAVKGSRPTSSASRTDRRLLAGIAMVQTALTLALLVGAGLLIRTVNNLARVRPGYDTQNLLAMSITQVRHAQHVEGMSDDENWARRFADFHRRVLTRVAALPGVKSAAFAWGVPLTGNKWWGEVAMDAQPAAGGRLEDLLAVPMRAVSPEYFDTVGLQILEGRNFRSKEAFSWPPAFTTNVPNVAIINQAMAERYFPKADPIGKTFRFSFENVRATAEIVGVAANSRDDAITQKAEPEIYFSYWQLPAGTKHLVVRTAADPRSFIGSVQRELRVEDPTVVIEDVRTFEQIRSDSIAPRLLAMRLLVGFSFAASVLALVGLYGVLSLSVGSRRREIAIRMAVGAQRRDVLGLVLSEGLKLSGVGLLLGLGIAIVFTRILRAFLFGVEPTDPITFVAVAVLFGLVTLLACYVPARRAAKTDPMTALRYE